MSISIPEVMPMLPNTESQYVNDSDYSQVLLIKIDNEFFGIDILNVQEIREVENYTRVPKANSCVRGLMNLRGIIAPVCDFRDIFGMPKRNDDPKTVTIILKTINQGKNKVFGLIVDSVSESVSLNRDQIQHVFETDEEHHHSKHVKALAIFQDQLLMLLNVESLFPAQNLID